MVAREEQAAGIIDLKVMVNSIPINALKLTFE
jgi:hypothetical protein